MFKMKAKSLDILSNQYQYYSLILQRYSYLLQFVVVLNNMKDQYDPKSENHQHCVRLMATINNIGSEYLDKYLELIAVMTPVSTILMNALGVKDQKEILKKLTHAETESHLKTIPLGSVGAVYLDILRNIEVKDLQASLTSIYEECKEFEHILLTEDIGE